MGWCHDPLPGSCRSLNVFARADEQRFGRRKFFSWTEWNWTTAFIQSKPCQWLYCARLLTVLYISVRSSRSSALFHWQGVCILPKAKEKIHRRIDIRFVASHCAFIGSLSNNDGDSATKTSLKKWSRAASNCISLIPSCSTRQMLAIFLELNSKRLYQSSGKLGKKKVVVLCSRPSQNVKLGIFTS